MAIIGRIPTLYFETDSRHEFREPGFSKVLLWLRDPDHRA